MKWGGHFGEQFGLLLKRVNMVLSDPEFTSRYLPKGSEMFTCGKTWIRIFVAAFFIGTPERRQPKCSHTGEALREDGVSQLSKTTSSEGDGLWGRAQREGSQMQEAAAAGFCSHRVSKTGPAREAPLRSAVA